MSKEVSKDSTLCEPQINVLEDVLNTIRFRGSIFFRSQLAAPWGFLFSESNSPRFHISLAGDFFIGSQKDQKTRINHMEIGMIPHGGLHWIADKQDSQLLPSEAAGEACSIGSPLHQEGTITNKLICGIIHYEKGLSHPVLDSLPDILHFTDIESDSPIWQSIMLIDTLMKGDYSSQSSIIDRMTEALFLQLLNKYAQENIESQGFFIALKNHRVHKTLKLIHQSPHLQWSLDKLGEQVGMSRSTIIRQFNQTLGMSPITYLNNWRMMRAYSLIKNTNKSLEQIAEIVGFATARTLNKAFLQHYAFTPSTLRKSL
jgi:AraC-like DNA-binding protein